MEVIHNKTLQAIPEIAHGFFTRKGGVSGGIYAGLNTSATSDQIEHVEENRRRAMSYFGYSLSAYASVNNLHGKEAVIAQSAWCKNTRPSADAMVTNQPHVVLAASTADCSTVLWVDPIARVIGSSHAGWRGALGGVLESTLDKMMRLGAKPERILVAVGPCIHQDFYEVDAVFYKQFLIQDPENERFFKSNARTNFYMFALPEYIKARLMRLQLKYISMETSLNTYDDEARFYSCRRAKHQGEVRFGGHLAAIVLK